MRGRGLPEARSDRINAWFDADEWTVQGDLKAHAIPKMRFADIEKQWPEYEILKTFKAHNFTLAAIKDDESYFEFDKSYGAYPIVAASMHPLTPTTKSSALTSPKVESGTSTQPLEDSDRTAIIPNSHISALETEHIEDDSQIPTGQDTDGLGDRSIPLYNFLVEYLRDHPQDWGRDTGYKSFSDALSTFPIAPKSTGSMVRDCALCYLGNGHCGYHALPDPSPYPQLIGPPYDKDNLPIPEPIARRVLYDMRLVCELMVMGLENDEKLRRIFAVMDYIGWFDTPNIVRHTLVNDQYPQFYRMIWEAARPGELPPTWEVLYQEFRAYGERHGGPGWQPI